MTTGGDGIQVDKGGFVRVHHTILELLAQAPLRGQQFRCLMFLFRETYGRNRKEKKISLNEWAAGTGMERHNVWRELQSLLKFKVIYANSSGAKRAMTWGFNKYHEQWSFESVVADDYKSVVANDYRFFKSVVADDYRFFKSVVADDYRSVVTSPHTRDLKDIKTTTTTTEGGGSSGGFASSQQDPILRCWEENMEAELTPIIIADLHACVLAHGADEVLNAIATAVRADNKTMRYVKGVLNRRREISNGHHINGHNTREVLVPIGDNHG